MRERKIGTEATRSRNWLAQELSPLAPILSGVTLRLEMAELGHLRATEFDPKLTARMLRSGHTVA
jgi:hypothetical protein